MSKHQPSVRLVDAGPVCIDLCECCDAIHLHLSSITLRIEITSFLQMTDAFVVARARLLKQWREGERGMPGRQADIV